MEPFNGEHNCYTSSSSPEDVLSPSYGWEPSAASSSHSNQPSEGTVSTSPSSPSDSHSSGDVTTATLPSHSNQPSEGTVSTSPSSPSDSHSSGDVTTSTLPSSSPEEELSTATAELEPGSTPSHQTDTTELGTEAGSPSSSSTERQSLTEREEETPEEKFFSAEAECTRSDATTEAGASSVTEQSLIEKEVVPTTSKEVFSTPEPEPTPSHATDTTQLETEGSSAAGQSLMVTGDASSDDFKTQPHSENKVGKVAEGGESELGASDFRPRFITLFSNKSAVESEGDYPSPAAATDDLSGGFTTVKVAEGDESESGASNFRPRFITLFSNKSEGLESEGDYPSPAAATDDTSGGSAMVLAYESTLKSSEPSTSFVSLSLASDHPDFVKLKLARDVEGGEEHIPPTATTAAATEDTSRPGHFSMSPAPSEAAMLTASEPTSFEATLALSKPNSPPPDDALALSSGYTGPRPESAMSVRSSGDAEVCTTGLRSESAMSVRSSGDAEACTAGAVEGAPEEGSSSGDVEVTSSGVLSQDVVDVSSSGCQEDASATPEPTFIVAGSQSFLRSSVNDDAAEIPTILLRSPPSSPPNSESEN